MTQQPKANFTQIPNVLFDTCDLPDETIMMFSRLYRLVGHKTGVFVGSIRKLAPAVNLKRDKAHRNLKELEKAGMVFTGLAQDVDVSAIQLNSEDLWELNEYAHNGVEIPRWTNLKEVLEVVRKIGQSEEKKEEASVLEIGQTVLEIGQDDAKTGQDVRKVRQTVRKSVLKGGGNTTKTINNTNINTSNTNSAAIAPQKEESKAQENNVIELSSRKTAQPSQTKSRTSKSKKPALSLQLTLPDLDAAPTLEAILQVGDYIRGYSLPEKNMKACREGAMALLQQKRPLRDILKVLVYMSPRDEIRAEFGMKFKDEGYLNGPRQYNDADLSNICDKMNNKLKDIARLEKQHNEPSPTQAHHIMQTAAAVEEKPLNETPEQSLENKRAKRLAAFIKNNPVVFWTTTKDVNTIKTVDKQPLEVLLTWKEMYVQEAIEQYGLTPLDYAYVPPRKNSLLSRIAVLSKQIVNA
jgi:hypothetical protein